MNILLVSECDKRALVQTRRILDQFAERRGERTWQTPITQEGLDTLRRLLRASARKNTAVACHWIRGQDHTELLWVVGDKTRFNAQGAVPTNTTRRDVLRADDENDWHSGELIRLLADLAGLMHDLGKASDAFQTRLRQRGPGARNLIRHEWVSLRLFQAFVGQDDDAAWLNRLAQLDTDHTERWLGSLCRDGENGRQPAPFLTLGAPLARALGWLIVTHHRLPILPTLKDGGKPALQMQDLPRLLDRVQPENIEPHFSSSTQPKDFAPHWRFSHVEQAGLPFNHPQWRQRAARLAQRLLAWLPRPELVDLGRNAFVLHLSRLCLMLADHRYSSLQGAHPQRLQLTQASPLLANTCDDGRPNQSLDEHLLGVAQLGAQMARFLPGFEAALPALGRCTKLRQRATLPAFYWQNRAAELAGGRRLQAQTHGAFIVNMASTGCGKTLANARVMYALADPQRGLRCAFAMGLRTLTLQTGRAFRQQLELGDDDLAIRVGGSASRALFEHFEDRAEAGGSGSTQALLLEKDEDGDVDFGGDTELDARHPLLARALHDPQVKKLLVAPLLVCTIDHLTPATESQRGGRQIAPILRLLSGDLVLDELDDFGMEDLPALTRLVHWAGLLGARVLVSSATLAPALVQGMFEAYRDGRQHFQRNRGARPGAPERAPEVCCLWLDEFAQVEQTCPDATRFSQQHLAFVTQRAQKLAQQAAQTRRRAALLPVPPLPADAVQACNTLAPVLLEAACQQHQTHAITDPTSGQRVSFGLIRMANIERLFDMALAFYRLGAPEGLQIHLCVYHSRLPLLVRSEVEHMLDTCLRRHSTPGQADPALSQPPIRQRLAAHPQAQHLFLVLSSPVAEVGRDHDFDWAIAEPSSMRSLIQLAGRIRRHRPGACQAPNLLVLRRNLRSFLTPGQASFRRPGFEEAQGRFRLNSPDVQALLLPEEYEVMDARPRILARPEEQWHPQDSLVDLEHARMQHQMRVARQAAAPAGVRQRGGGAAATPALVCNAATWWQPEAAQARLTAVLQQQTPFRASSGPDEVALVWLADEDGELRLHRVVEDKHQATPYAPVDRQFRHDLPDSAVQGVRISPWGVTDLEAAVARLAQEKGMSLAECAQRFTTATVLKSDRGWRFHPALGFAKKHDH